MKNTETLKLGDIATISTGVVVSRKKADFSPVKTYKMLTLKSFEENGWVNKKELDKFDSLEVLSEQYLTQNGDVVIRLSSPNTTIYIEEKESGLVITSLFAVIRAKNNKIIPDFLAIYLNSQKTKKRLSQASIGSAISIVKTSTLKELEIQVPSIQHQQKVVKLHSLIQRERKLYMQLLEDKEKMYHAIIDQVIEGGRKDDSSR
ncbi:restriction endonuclease subunit S [Alkaliphilus sp. B6464]|uniref:restriction endonuclease subunit S n=1 Tax=Alkaliphilus sp. B6464 TaxID=2731219 RepID=UPI001BA917AA|nr:restriction endonuclease subunit S [Alkaliphilus sp. B6464]QUH18957.1 restriction endonuclease subunit S [Alkaliphilus sp. B6464]